MLMLRNYLLYKFEVNYISRHQIRDSFDDVICTKEVPSTQVISVIAPKYDGEEVARLFILNKFKYSVKVENVKFLESSKIDGVVWMENA